MAKHKILINIILQTPNEACFSKTVFVVFIAVSIHTSPAINVVQSPNKIELLSICLLNTLCVNCLATNVRGHCIGDTEEAFTLKRKRRCMELRDKL